VSREELSAKNDVLSPGRYIGTEVPEEGIVGPEEIISMGHVLSEKIAESKKLEQTLEKALKGLQGGL
jgi:hypothetical protein